MSWVCLRIAIRQEKRTLAKLTDEGVFAYCPMETRKITVRTRYVTRIVPRTSALFPGYIFAYLPDDQAIDAARSVRTVRDIMADAFGKPLKVDVGRLRAVFLADMFRAFDETYTPPRIKGKRYTHKFKVGAQVKIAQGPFQGFIGEVMRTRGRKQVELMFSIFGRTQELTIEEEHLVAAQHLAPKLAA